MNEEKVMSLAKENIEIDGVMRTRSVMMTLILDNDSGESDVTCQREDRGRTTSSFAPERSGECQGSHLILMKYFVCSIFIFVFKIDL